MDIRSALYVLQGASDDNLRLHAGETILTLRKIGERLQVNLFNTPCETTIEDATSSSNLLIPSEQRTEILTRPARQNAIEPRCGSYTREAEQNDSHSPTEQIIPSRPNHTPSTDKAPTGRDNKHPKDAVSGLSSAIKRTIPWLWEASRENLTLSNKRKPDEDPRLEDFRRVEGESKPSERNKLLRLLAIRSLALDFTAEQMIENSQTKVDELVGSLRSMENSEETVIKAKGRRSEISNFVKSHPRLSGSPGLSQKAINSGIKHLVFEKALMYRLQEQDLPSQVEVVSAILGQNINNFKNLSYRGMSEVLDAMLSDQSKLSLSDDSGKENEYYMMDVIRNANEWFTRLQAEYNDLRSRTFLSMHKKPFSKRARQDRSNCASRRFSPQSDDDDSRPDVETCEEGRFNDQTSPTRPFPNHDSSRPENFNSLGNLNPSQNIFEDFTPSLDIFQNSNPSQDIFEDFIPCLDIFQTFTPSQDLFQDFTTSQDIHIPHFNYPDLSTEETTSTIPATVDRDVDRQDDRDATFLTSTNNPQMQSVC